MDLTARLTSFDAGDNWSAVWARSGAMSLSGREGGAPLPVPIDLVRVVTAAAHAIGDLTADSPRQVLVDGPALLGERAALLGLGRRGATSCGGSTRLFRTADGWIALSLAREDDRSSVAAWLGSGETSPGDDDRMWSTIESACARRSAEDLVRRAALLGLPCGGLGEVDRRKPLIGLRRALGPSAERRLDDVLVVDLSSLWAGPLCANLLGLSGARVIKVESERRPDGARSGNGDLFDLLHGGHESVVLDLTAETGVSALRRLIERADVVIEASRPRALDQLGVTRGDEQGPKVWLSITGHGTEGCHAHRVGFGDDTAVAGGLVTSDDAGFCFCADAVADPATGLIAAAAVLDRLAIQGRWTIDVALSRTAAWLATGQLTQPVEGGIAPPRHRPVTAAARGFGADTEAVLRELRIRR